jgi:hypothetical protein
MSYSSTPESLCFYKDEEKKKRLETGEHGNSNVMLCIKIQQPNAVTCI